MQCERCIHKLAQIIHPDCCTSFNQFHGQPRNCGGGRNRHLGLYLDRRDVCHPIEWFTIRLSSGYQRFSRNYYQRDYYLHSYCNGPRWDGQQKHYSGSGSGCGVDCSCHYQFHCNSCRYGGWRNRYIVLRVDRSDLRDPVERFPVWVRFGHQRVSLNECSCDDYLHSDCGRCGRNSQQEYYGYSKSCGGCASRDSPGDH